MISQFASGMRVNSHRERAFWMIPAALVTAAALSATANAGLIHDLKGDAAVHESSASTLAAAGRWAAPHSDSRVSHASHALTGRGLISISSSIPVTGHATSMLAIQGEILTGHRASVGGGPGAGSPGQGAGGGGMGTKGLSGVFPSSNPEATVSNPLPASLATYSMLAAPSNLVLPLFSPERISPGDLISASTISQSSDAPVSSDVVVPDAVPKISGLEVADSLSQPVLEQLVLHNPEPASIVIFAGLCGALAIGWLRRRKAAVQSPVS